MTAGGAGAAGALLTVCRAGATTAACRGAGAMGGGGEHVVSKSQPAHSARIRPSYHARGRGS